MGAIRGTRSRRVAVWVLSALLVGSLSFTAGGCGDTQTSDPATTGELPTEEIVIGTMATEDILPMWVAESEGLFTEAGLNARVEVFQSAQELTVALTSGEVVFAMTDPMVSASLVAAGTDVTMEWVTLGATAEQGRFGIMTSAESGITSLEDLAGKGIGVGSNTILEYVMDNLMEQAGVPSDQVVTEEIKKLPVRYEMMASNQVAAAALPGSLLALGEATGSIVLADDTQGDNISQSVMVVSSRFAENASGQAAVAALKEVWNQAVDRINADPDAYRSLLGEKANLADSVVETYPISTYPQASYPAAETIEPVLDWMRAKGYLSIDLTYDASTGAFIKQ